MGSNNIPSHTSPSLEILGPDILHTICSLISSQKGNEHPRDHTPHESLLALSQMSRMLRELSSPFLFRKVSIRDDLWPKGGWEKFETKLKELSEERFIHQFIKTFDFIVCLNEEIQERPPPGMCHLLTSTLRRLSKLHTFKLELPVRYIDVWSHATTIDKLILPNIETLSLTSFCEFLVPVCPNVRTIQGVSSHYRFEGRDGLYIIEAAVRAKKLTNLKIIGQWTIKMMEALIATSNGIQTLSTITPARSTDLPKLLSHLTSLPNLQSLELDRASNLKVGFHPPKCGNAYHGPNGPAVRKRVREQGKDAEERVVKMVDGKATTALRKVRIGGSIFEKRAEGDTIEEGEERVGCWVRNK